MKRFGELKYNERSIYNAFSNAEPYIDQHHMGDLVNRQSLDADDILAIPILANKYRFDKINTSTGKEFKKNTTHERGTEIIALVTENKPNIFNRLHSANRNTINKILSDEKIHSLNWHTLYGRVRSGNEILWSDDLNLRPKGPGDNDFILYFSRSNTNPNELPDFAKAKKAKTKKDKKAK